MQWNRVFESRIALAVLAVVCAQPLWSAAHPPLQDLPYQLATARVLHDFADPAYGFSAHFEKDLAASHALGFFALADGLSFLVGVRAALLALVTLYFVGVVLGVRAVAVSLGRDPRVALLALPLCHNRLWTLGLLPFLFAIPWMLAGIAAAIELGRLPTPSRAVAFVALALGTFFFHTMPFAILVATAFVVVPRRGLQRPLIALVPVALTGALAGGWLALAPGARALREGNATHTPALAALWELPRWLTDVFPDRTGLPLLAALGSLAVAATVLGQRSGPSAAGNIPARLALVAAVVLGLYFVAPASREYVWPIAGRLPLLALLVACTIVLFPAGRLGHGIAVAAVVLSLGSTWNVHRHFKAFDEKEAAGFDALVETIPPRARVAALMYKARSRYVRDAPFLHFGSYYQLEKGGVVGFTFAGYPHWPFRFRADAEPPTGPRFPLGWEWKPYVVSAKELADYYDYVVTRGRGFYPAGEYEVAVTQGDWHLWKRAKGSSGIATLTL